MNKIHLHFAKLKQHSQDLYKFCSECLTAIDLILHILKQSISFQSNLGKLCNLAQGFSLFRKLITNLYLSCKILSE
jgi:hypothetical protein